MWLVFALLTVLSWGASETIFKRSTKEDEQSVVRLLAYNGIFFGISGIIYMLVVFRGFNFDPAAILTYLPVAALYILSMFSYYHAMKRVKISIISPIVNSSCVVTVMLSIIFLAQRPSMLQSVAVLCIIFAIIGMSFNKEEGGAEESRRERKLSLYAAGLLFAFGYFALDGVASFMDAYSLEALLSEEEVLVSYALIYLVVGIICHMYIRVKDKNFSIKLMKLDKFKFVGTVFETFGQYTFIYAMGSGMSAVVSPVVASYSAVTIILSRIFLKERLKSVQYMWVVIILAGIIALSFE